MRISEQNRNINYLRVKEHIPNQNDMVLVTLGLLGVADAETIWLKCQELFKTKAPLTSFRRSITNLKAELLIAETERISKTQYGGTATIYKLSFLGEKQCRELSGKILSSQGDLFNGMS